ncbi:MAG: sigma-70 family RNA polymerase sigma factor [Candidatus Eisenbacteria bacterium]
MATELTLTFESGRGSIPEVTLESDERAWILRCQSGDRAAFEPLVQRYMRRAAAFALGWAGNHEDALDLSQEAFARAFRAIRRFDPDRPFYPWFHRILRNLCINHIGRARHSREVALDDEMPLAGSEPSPSERAERAELRRTVRAAIRRLQPQDREILILREFQDQSYAEIADVLQIPKGTVMSRLHNARRRLRLELEASAPELLQTEES